MSILKFTDEKDLQRSICKILNRFGYHFEKGNDNYFCDIFDPMIKCYCEVKIDGKFAPHQLLYGLAKENIQDAQYLALANEYEIRFYPSIPFNKILAFAKIISPNLIDVPSKITSKKAFNDAFDLLGNQFLIYNYCGDFNIGTQQPYIFLNKSNYEYFQLLLQKYRISPSEFINKFSKTWVSHSQLYIRNDNMTIFDMESGNQVKAQRQILDKFDRQLIQSTRIKGEEVESIIHKIDELLSIDARRKRGKFWTSKDLSEITEDLIREYVQPTVIFEPFVGGGSLIRPFVENCRGIVNDIDKNSVNLLEKEFEGFDWKYKKENLLTTHQSIINSWIELSENDTFLVYSNPPFGTSSTNKLASRSEEIVLDEESEKLSRKVIIPYGSDEQEISYFTKKYGKGDLSIISIARMIETIKNKGNGYLAFFSPFGILLGRERYNKLLNALLENFEFIYGEVFSGNKFNGVSKNKAISFTIWKYHPNVKTHHESMQFNCDGALYSLKTIPLLKHGWKYNQGKDGSEIGASRNDTFNNPNPKMIKIELHNAGSQMIQENVKKPLNVPNLSDPFIYGLWSVCVGIRSITSYPLMFDNCYTHLPDFSKEETIEILAYITLHTVITEELNNYCKGKIGFVGLKRIFHFGGDQLTKDANYLIEKYKDLPIGGMTIGNVFQRLKSNELPNDVDPNLRKNIKIEIEKRLQSIDYWKYLPIADIEE